MSSFSIPPSGFESPPSSSSESRKRKLLCTPSPARGQPSEEGEPSPHTPFQSSFGVCPGTVSKHSQFHLPTAPLFDNPQRIEVEGDLPQLMIPPEVCRTYSRGHVYVENGKTHNIFKQQSTKDCGAASLLMLFSDIARMKNTIIKTNQAFTDWLTQCSLENAESLINIARVGAGIGLEKTKISTKTPLQNLRELIEKTGLPIISAITHPIIQGHWILVDHVSETESFIRDPRAGQAYAVPNGIMESYYTDIPESALSFIGE